MSEAPTLDVPKLTEQEMQQLQVLLFRYLTHKSSGFADIVTDKLINRCQATASAEPPSAEAVLPPSVEAPKRKGKAAPASAS